MNTQDFDFALPESLIAQYPLARRRDSRLLVADAQAEHFVHQQFHQLVTHLRAGDVLVMNNSKVIPARLYGRKESGGQVEILVERIVDSETCWAHIKASKAPRPGAVIHLEEGHALEVQGRDDALFLCRSKDELMSMLEAIGHIPLPPYIQRPDDDRDSERYQTVYAKTKGSVAAPTAGLHFDEDLLAQLTQMGVTIVYTTLHVGAGTFQPVRVQNIADHKMHKEFYVLEESSCQAILAAKAEQRRVIAVGTTAMRSIESAARGGSLRAGQGDTDIFITPGYAFQMIDGLITNFHLPQSTLLMLVAAFIGYDTTMRLYQEAIAQGYRFFSYGDACLLWRAK
ncbi:MAG: tRNA preQ1(34) S-adenosylmethionine ribosyltransferase-isomerase QueA [Legionellaceae bacterium]|nr:tRNA preQ1(34) S-adenosylmethionine ribosyltransferase-isomerase QueA [Legionellaceae bacterium]